MWCTMYVVYTVIGDTNCDIMPFMYYELCKLQRNYHNSAFLWRIQTVYFRK